MKRLLKFSLLLLALLLPEIATAHDIAVDGIYYLINGTKATVTFLGTNSSQYDEYYGAVVIPETVSYDGTTYSVTAIGSSAFDGCPRLKSVTIPNSVTYIGNYAFAFCTGLTSVTIPNAVTEIGYYAFYRCSGLTSVTIGNSVTHIDESAFEDCSGLTGIVIPNSVISMGGHVFDGTAWYSNQPDGLVYAGLMAYNYKGTMPEETSITLRDGTLGIAGSAFYNCSGLTSIDIPNTVTNIGGSAFKGCRGLTSVNIPNSVTNIGQEVFCDCSGLTRIEIPNSVTYISSSAFKGCRGLTSVTIPNSVDYINYAAFYGCSGLTSVTIPNSVTNIGIESFYNCSSIRNLFFNATNCVSIGDQAFSIYNNYSSYNSLCVQDLQFGDSVQHIPMGLPTFNMTGKTLVLPNSIKTIDAGAINGCCVAVVIGNGIENIAAGTFPSGISVAYATTVEPLPCEAGAFANPQTLYVPEGSRMKYFTAQGWSEFADIIEGEYIVADSIILNNTGVIIPKESTIQLNATILPIAASAASVNWYSINPNIATVDNNGIVSALAVGETDILASVDNVIAVCHVTVTPILVENISLSDNYLSMALNEMNFLTVTAITPVNAENQTLEWEIPDNDVIVTQLVNNTRLNIGAIGEGTVTITVLATDGSGVSASCVVTVSQINIQATSIALDETSVRVTKGETLQLTAAVLPEDATNKSVAWTSSNPEVASVDGDGLVMALAGGTTTITATTTDGTNLSASCVVTVTEDFSDYENYLSIDNLEAYHGDTIVIPVKMFNEASIISFQTDIFLPEGLELLQEDGEYLIDPSERMTSTHSISSNDVSNGSVRVICYSSNYKSFTGNSGGDLFYLTVKVADDAEGDYTIRLKNTLLTTTEFEELAAPDAVANVNVKAYLLGDANNSGTVTITDVVFTSQYVLEMNPQPFIFEAADVNFDGTISVTDVSRIVWMVLNPKMNMPLRASTLCNNGDCMSGKGVSLMPGEPRRVSIMLDNAMDYSAFQFDLMLPDGLMADNFRLTDRAGSHTFNVNMLANGKMRALCYSPALSNISGHEGALLSFDVTANGVVTGDIMVDGIEMVTTSCQTVKLDAFAIGVNNSSSVNGVSACKSVAKVEYFNLAGQQITEPTDGVTLVVTTYTDGTRSTTKVMR